jgi:hypothetical protein
MIRVLGVLETERLLDLALLPVRALRVLVVALLPVSAVRVADDLPESPAVSLLLLLAELLLYTPLLLPERLCVRLL